MRTPSGTSVNPSVRKSLSNAKTPIEREDAFDPVGSRERSRRVIDERNPLVVDASELVADHLELLGGRESSRASR